MDARTWVSWPLAGCSRLAELAWSAALVAWRRTRRPTPPRPWKPAGGPVVVVAPHPDDETVGAGGAIALHVRAGEPVKVVVVTDGGASRAGGLGPGDMAARRALEVERAAQVLRVGELVRLGLPEGGWEEDALGRALATHLTEASLVYAPGPVDFHPGHLRVARVVARHVRADQRVRVYQVGVPLFPLADVVADTSPAEAAKREALDAFVTQRRALEPLPRLVRYGSALYGTPSPEVFWELSGGSYTAAVGAGPDPNGPGPPPFYGLRRWAFTDPLAFLLGRTARGRIRDAALAAGRSLKK